MRQRSPKRSAIAQRTYAKVERDIFEQGFAQTVKAKEHGVTIPAEVAAPAVVDGRDPFEMARLANELLRSSG